MADADNRSDEDKKMAERRMTDPGIYAIGDEVIWDGEAETLGVPPKTTIELPAQLPLDPDDGEGEPDGGEPDEPPLTVKALKKPDDD